MLYSIGKTKEKPLMNLQELENEIISDRNYHRTIHTDRDPRLFVKLMLSILALFLLNCGCLFAVPCPHCREEIDVIVGKGYFFPDSWTCRHCGYENYDGIHYCAVCGERASVVCVFDGEIDE